MKIKEFYIYKITNLINNKIYIGRHINKQKNDTYFGSGTLITRAIAKYGKDNFKKEIIYYCSSNDELNKKEIYYIKEYNSIFPNGYNISTGGTRVFVLENHPDQEAIRKKISDSHKNKKLSEDHKLKIKEGLCARSEEDKKETSAKMSKAHKGKIKSPQHRQKIGESNRGKKGKKTKGFSGRKHTKETKEKLSIIHLGTKMPPRSDEWKIKQSLAQKGKKRKPFTDEHKEKLSASIKKSLKIKKEKNEIKKILI